MARATFVKSAQKDIYEKGKVVSYISEKGKNIGSEKSKLDRTIPADKNDKIFIAKGESYYWWQFKNGPKHYSKTAPKRSQLTGSSFLGQLYDLEDSIADFTADNTDDFDAFKEDVLSQIEDLKSECESSLENMPESLQSSPTGELLQERIDALENWYSEIEGIECDIDEDGIKEEIESEHEGEDDYDDEQLQSDVDERISEKVMEAVEELQGTSAGL